MFKSLWSLAGLLALVACQNKSNPNTLNVCTNSTYPPYESIDTHGNSVGFDIDIAGELAKRLGKQLTVRELAFDSLILSLQQNKCDLVLSGMSITKTRQKEIALIPYQGEAIKSYYLLFWNQPPQTLEQLKGKTVAVQIGTWMEDYLRTQKEITSKALESNSELVMDIQYKKSAAVFAEPHIAKNLMQKESNLKFIEVTLPESEWRLGNGIGIKKSNAALIKQIEETVAQMKSDDSIHQLEKKWFHKQ